MACILKCPECETYLREEGDNSKNHPGEYRVYDSLPNCKIEAGQFRIVQCLECHHVGSPGTFSNY